MHQFNKKRFSAIPPNGKLHAALLLSEMLNPPIAGQGSVDFQPDSVIRRDNHRVDMHAGSELRVTAKAPRMLKPRGAYTAPLVRVTVLAGLSLTFAGIAWIF